MVSIANLQNEIITRIFFFKVSPGCAFNKDSCSSSKGKFAIFFKVFLKKELCIKTWSVNIAKFAKIDCTLFKPCA